jgi:hypothetical protein
MSNNKQSSSIEWLVEILGKYNEEMVFLYQNEIEQAKAMHKEEIENALIDGAINERVIEYRIPHYYNETFNK